MAEYIFWGLDEMLMFYSKGDNSYLLRNGIDMAMAGLSEDGYQHVLASVGSAEKSIEELSRLGLRKHFGERVFHVEDPGSTGRRYVPICHLLGLSLDETKKCLAITGHGHGCSDIESLSVIQYENSPAPLRQLREVVNYLRLIGEGDLPYAIARLYEQRGDTFYDGSLHSQLLIDIPFVSFPVNIFGRRMQFERGEKRIKKHLESWSFPSITVLPKDIPDTITRVFSVD
ncbi:MAG: hypothetical protein V1808_00675 [Candidatus Daviesbacteria bacterium]